MGPATVPDPNRIQRIFQKHADALARELSRELTRPLAERLGITLADTDAEPPVADAPSEPFVPAALLYDVRLRRWSCPKCRAFSDLRRRAVTTHMRFCSGTPATPPKPARVVRRKRKKKKS